MIKQKWLDQLCEENEVSLEELSEASGVDKLVLERIYYRRWTPSPEHRWQIAKFFHRFPEDIVWGHATLVQLIKGPA